MNDISEPDQPGDPKSERGSLLEGFLVTGALHVVGLPAAALMTPLFSSDPYSVMVPVLLFGGIQLIYMLPALGIVAYLRRWTTFKVMAIVTGVLLLLNSACWGLVMLSGLH